MELWISLLLDYDGIKAEWIIGPAKFARIWNRLLELDAEAHDVSEDDIFDGGEL